MRRKVISLFLAGTALGPGAAWGQDLAARPGDGSTAPSDQASSPGQATPARAAGGLEEIVVTAQRREENLQNVPVAVTAISASTLANFRVTNVQNISGLAPNVKLSYQGSQINPQIQIRGVASGVANPSVDPKIGIYVDGVYIGRTTGATFDLPDIERVEILRGPQGTLFGRNATGGAISLTTAAPTGELSVAQDLSIGNYEMRRSRTTVNLPRLGPLSVKVSYLHDEAEGRARNLIAGKTLDYSQVLPRFGTLRAAKTLGARNTEAVQAAARLDFGNGFTADYRFDFNDSNTTGEPVQFFGPIGSTAPLAGAVIAFQPLFGGTTNISRERIRDVANFSTVQHLRVQGHSLTLNWDASDLISVKSITAYRKYRQDPAMHDLGASGGYRFSTAQLGALLTGRAALIPTLPVTANDQFSFLRSARQSDQQQFSQEVQFVVTTKAVDLTAGAFYFHEKSGGIDYLGIFQPADAGVIRRTPFDASFGNGTTEVRAVNDALALYGQATVHITDKLDITGGLRFSVDDRELNLVQIVAASGGGLQPGVYKLSYNRVNYTAIASYRPSENVTAYGKVSTAYVAGGILAGTPYAPESLIAYEGGVKFQAFGSRLRANFAGYYMNYKDIQIQQFINGVQLFQNAGKAHTYGAELEVDAVPTRGLTLGGTFGYQRFIYDEYLDRGVNLASNATPRDTPKFNMRLSGQYDFPEFNGGGNLFARIDSRFQTRSEVGTFGTGSPALDAFVFVKKNWLVDGRIGVVKLPLGGATVGSSFFMQNIFNDNDVLSFAPTAVNQIGVFRPGRTYGLDFSVRF